MSEESWRYWGQPVIDDVETINTHPCFATPLAAPLIDFVSYRLLPLDGVFYISGEQAMPNPADPLQHPFCLDNEKTISGIVENAPLDQSSFRIETANIFLPHRYHPNDPDKAVYLYQAVPVVYFDKLQAGIVLLPAPIPKAGAKRLISTGLALVSKRLVARTIIGDMESSYRHRYLFAKTGSYNGVDCVFYGRNMRFTTQETMYHTEDFIKEILSRYQTG